MTTKFNAKFQCRGKVRFPTKAAAKEAIRKSEQIIGARMQAYRCPHCADGTWHIGHRLGTKAWVET